MPASATDLRSVLDAMAPAPTGAARERMLTAMSDAVESAPRSRRSKWRWAITGVAALLFAVSPPGQALGDRLGELVGIGEESSVTEPDLRDPRLDRSQERVGPAIVAASGTVPGVDEPFEILAWAGKSKGPVPARSQEATTNGEIVSCMGSVYPNVGKQWTTKICLGPRDEPSVLHVISVGTFRPNTDPIEQGAPYVIEGQVSDETAKVVLGFQSEDGSRHEVEATLGVTSPEIARLTGMEQRIGFFSGFIPYDGGDRIDYGLVDSRSLRTLEVTTYDSEGRVIESRDEGARYSRAVDSALRRDRLAAAATYAACQKYSEWFPAPECDRASDDAAQTPGAKELAGTLEVSRIGDAGVYVRRGNFETFVRF